MEEGPTEPIGLLTETHGVKVLRAIQANPFPNPVRYPVLRVPHRHELLEGVNEPASTAQELLLRVVVAAEHHSLGSPVHRHKVGALPLVQPLHRPPQVGGKSHFVTQRLHAMHIVT